MVKRLVIELDGIVALLEPLLQFLDLQLETLLLFFVLRFESQNRVVSLVCDFEAVNGLPIAVADILLQVVNLLLHFVD